MNDIAGVSSIENMVLKHVTHPLTFSEVVAKINVYTYVQCMMRRSCAQDERKPTLHPTEIM